MLRDEQVDLRNEFDKERYCEKSQQQSKHTGGFYLRRTRALSPFLAAGPSPYPRCLDLVPNRLPPPPFLGNICEKKATKIGTVSNDIDKEGIQIPFQRQPTRVLAPVMEFWIKH
jgi:hypothetical protein